MTNHYTWPSADMSFDLNYNNQLAFKIIDNP